MNILLFDGSNIIKRCYHILKETATGKIEDTVSGCINKQLNLGLPISKVFFIYDFGIPTHILKIYPEYKMNRKGTITLKQEENFIEAIRHEVGEELFKSIKGNRDLQEDIIFQEKTKVQKWASSHGYFNLEIKNLEADSFISLVIGFLKIEFKDDLHIRLVSSDKDFLQLLRYPEIEIFKPGLTKEDTYFSQSDFNRTQFLLGKALLKDENFKLHPALISIARAFMGDTGDNIGKIKGYGEVATKNLISQVPEDIIQKMNEYPDFNLIKETLEKLEIKKPIDWDILRRNFRIMDLDYNRLIKEEFTEFEIQKIEEYVKRVIL